MVPDVKTILAFSASTVREIPTCLVREVSAVLADILSDLVSSWSWEAAHRWYCFPKLVLRAAMRGGGEGTSEGCGVDLKEASAFVESSRFA